MKRLGDTGDTLADNNETDCMTWGVYRECDTGTFVHE